MRLSALVESEIKYARKMLEAGFSARGAEGHGALGNTLKQELARSARGAWFPAVLGTTVGLLAVNLVGKRKPGSGALVGALIGGALGFSGAVVWNSRETTSKMLRQAGKDVGAIRDARWLERHPIDFA